MADVKDTNSQNFKWHTYILWHTLLECIFLKNHYLKHDVHYPSINLPNWKCLIESAQLKVPNWYLYLLFDRVTMAGLLTVIFRKTKQVSFHHRRYYYFAMLFSITFRLDTNKWNSNVDVFKNFLKLSKLFLYLLRQFTSFYSIRTAHCVIGISNVPMKYQ